MLPAAVMPEVLLRRLPDPALEHVRVVGHDALDVGLAIARVTRLDGLEGQVVPPRRLTKGDAKHDRRTEDQGRGGEAQSTTWRYGLGRLALVSVQG